MTTTPTSPVKGSNVTRSPASPYHRTSKDPVFVVRRKSHVYRRSIKRAIQSARNLTGSPLSAEQRGACHFFLEAVMDDRRR